MGRSKRIAPALLGSALLAVGMGAARAGPIEDLQGAWVMDGTECEAVFEGSKGKVRFRNRTFATEHGFIVSGKKASGPIAGCTISKVEEQDNRFSALIACSDTLVSKEFQMSFRIIDADHFEPLDRFPDFTIKYMKCVL
jgi:hypothetical protein